MTGASPPPAYPADAPIAAPAPRRARTPWLAILVAFLLGVATVVALVPAVQKWRARGTAPAAQPSAAPVAVSPAITAATPITPDGLAAREAALDAQLRGIEARMAAADAGSRTAAGYATRAEGLLVAFAARRAIDRGLALGYIEGQLRARFAADEPQAAAAVIAASKAPLTREDLRLGLDTIAPQLTSSTMQGGFWRSVGREMSNLVVLRRETTPSPRAEDRLERARRLLDAGNVEAALAEVARMPGAAGATSWMDAAKRYNATRRALNQLEQAAVGGRVTPVVGPPAAPAAPPPPVAPAPAQNPAGQLPGA